MATRPNNKRGLVPSIIKLTSFGYAFLAKDKQPPPLANLERDVRLNLRNPMDWDTLKRYSGLHNIIRRHLLDTPGANEFIEETIAAIELLPPDEPRSIAIGCVAGRHRSVGLVEIIAARLKQRGHKVKTEHLHLARAMKNEPLH